MIPANHSQTCSAFTNIFRSRENKLLVVLLVLALLLRIAFSFYFSKYYFGEIKFTFGDSFSYSESFLNLIKYGLYTFDISNSDAYIYRGPIYPFFWGLHYLLFGENYVYASVAVTQCLIDTTSGFIIYEILKTLTNSYKWSMLGAAIYLFNPIFLVHVPMTGTETFAIFIVLLLFYFCIKANSLLHWFCIGGFCAIAVMTRQYLGILLPVVIFYALIQSNQFNLRILSSAFLIIMGFAVTVSPWFFRNAINHNAPTILMGQTPGYGMYQEDYIAFNKFYTLFFVDITPMFLSLTKTGEDGITQSSLFSPYEEEVKQAGRLAFECGPSFRFYHTLQTANWSISLQTGNYTGCKQEVVERYNSLREKFISEKGLIFLFSVPLENINKAIFKDKIIVPHSASDMVIGLIFNIRMFIVISSFLVFIVAPWRKEYVFMFYPVILILYLSFVARQVEMRYLVQSDAIMIVFAVLAWQATLDKLKLLFVKTPISANK